MTIKSGSLIINAEGLCSSQMSPEGCDAPIEVKATYALKGPKAAMPWQEAGLTRGTVEGDTFTRRDWSWRIGRKRNIRRKPR